MATGIPPILEQSVSQVRILLSTRHPDIAIPETPGPILVNTSKK